jgi:uncharacterized membrane protein YhaH (DUF805 family)/Tfp pilus assembly major pilin PilA
MDQAPEQATEIKFFDASTRIGRVRYLAYPWGVVLLLLPAIVLVAIGFVMHMALIAGLLLFAVEIFALVMTGVFIVRRLHDFDRSGWWSLIYWALQIWSFVLTFHQVLTDPLGPRPLGAWLPGLFLIIFLLVMVLVPGTRGPNRYGPVPPPNSTWVLVGAWMLLVVFVLGILAAIAIPAYQDFIARSQTAEGIQLAGGAEVGVSEYYQQHKSWPDKLEDVYGVAAQQPAGRYVESVSGAGNGLTYGVTSTMKSTSVNRMVAGKSLEIWTTDGGSTWHCGPGGLDPVDPKFVPASCRETGAP